MARNKNIRTAETLIFVALAVLIMVGGLIFLNGGITGFGFIEYGEIGIKQCYAEDAATSSGSWGTVCDNTYPGAALFYDDSSYEVHRVRKLGGGLYWAGLRINSTNTSVTDCDRINSVYLCYKWWSATTDIQTCDISVDANGGASYTAVTTTCPGTSEPTGVTCTDVTSLETWTCDNFFGSTGASAKSELRSSGGGNGYFDITWDVLYFNVTYESDTTPPNVTLIQPSDGYYTDTNSPASVTFTCNATDNINLKNISLYITDSFNSSFGLSQTTSVSGTNASASWMLSLSNGNYTWNCLAYDSKGNFDWGDQNRSIKINFTGAAMGPTSNSPIDQTVDLGEDSSITWVLHGSGPGYYYIERNGDL